MGQIDDVKEYLHGNRRGKTANRIEREALSDPFLYEALEGLTSTPNDPLDGLIRLERQLNDRAYSSRKKNYTWIYVAASLFVLVALGIGYFVGSEDSEKNIPMAKMSAPLHQERMAEKEVDSSIRPSQEVALLVVGQMAKDSSIQKEPVEKIQAKVVAPSESPKIQVASSKMKVSTEQAQGFARAKEKAKDPELDMEVSKEDVRQFNRYLDEALLYPKTDAELNSGTIVLSFEVNAEKVPSRIRIQSGFSKESNQEIIRLLATGPKWKNTPSGKRIQVVVRLTLDRDGKSYKAVLSVPSSKDI